VRAHALFPGEASAQTKIKISGRFHGAKTGENRLQIGLLSGKRLTCDAVFEV
jgi:hypothetical protein